MRNAHLRLGRAEYITPPASRKSTSIHVCVAADRFIVEPAAERGAAHCHLLSVFGGEQEIAAIHAAITEGATLRLSGPGLTPTVASLGEQPLTSRGLLQVPGRRHAVRHLVAISRELFETQPGGDPQANRTILFDSDPSFVAYRLAVRFGIPFLPEWSEWFIESLRRRNQIQELVGLGCEPVIVAATKGDLLELLSKALSSSVLCIPEGAPQTHWDIPQSFVASADA